MEGRGREAGGQAAAGGAPLTRQLREEETTGWPFDEGEKKRRRRRVGSLAQRVAWVLDAVATTGIGFGGDGIGREVGDEAGFDWAKLGRAACWHGPDSEILKGKISWAAKVSWAEKEKGCSRNPIKFSHGFWVKKIKGFKYFEAKFELGQTWINLNKVFEYFYTMLLLKISLNIQIQTKALNERLLNRFKKRFWNEIWIFWTSKNILRLRNKNMHSMKCNLSNCLKLFLLLFRWYALTWQVLFFLKIRLLQKVFWGSQAYGVDCPIGKFELTLGHMGAIPL
jgi:hypothetical protein